MATLECFKQFVNEVNDVDHDFRIVFVPEPQNCTRQVKSCLPEHYDFQLSVASNWRFLVILLKIPSFYGPGKTQLSLSGKPQPSLIDKPF